MSPVELALPVFYGAIALEAATSAIRRDRHYALGDTLANLLLGTGNLVADSFWVLVAYAIYAAVHAHAPWHVPTHEPSSWLALFLLDDLAYYAFHRASHRCRILWASHVVHHSSERFNLSTATRQTWTWGFFGWLFWAPLALLGFHPLMILTMQGLSLVFQFFLHTPYVGALGPIGWLLNTPSHHRAHHAKNPEYLDVNYGGILIVWDRLFGTFEPEVAPCEYGITKAVASRNPIVLALHEYAAIGRDVVAQPGRVLGHVFGPPGPAVPSRRFTWSGAGVAAAAVLLALLPLAFARAGEEYVRVAIVQHLIGSEKSFDGIFREEGLGPPSVATRASFDASRGTLDLETLEPEALRGDALHLEPGALTLVSRRRSLTVSVRNAPRYDRARYLRALTDWRVTHYRFESEPAARGRRWFAEPLVAGLPRVVEVLDGVLPLEVELPGYRASFVEAPRPPSQAGGEASSSFLEWDLADATKVDPGTLDWKPLALVEPALPLVRVVRGRASWPVAITSVHERAPFYVTLTQSKDRGLLDHDVGLPFLGGRLRFAGETTVFTFRRDGVELLLVTNLPWPELRTLRVTQDFPAPL